MKWNHLAILAAIGMLNPAYAQDKQGIHIDQYKESFSGAYQTSLEFAPQDLLDLQFSFDRHQNPYSISTGANPFKSQKISYKGAASRLAATTLSGPNGEFFQLPILELQNHQKVKFKLDARTWFDSQTAGGRYSKLADHTALLSYLIEKLDYCDIRAAVTNSPIVSDALFSIQKSQFDIKKSATITEYNYHNVDTLEYENTSGSPECVRLRVYIPSGMNFAVFGSTIDLHYTVEQPEVPRPEPLDPSQLRVSSLPEKPYKISFHYDLSDNGASFERVCRSFVNNVAQPGVGMDKLIRSGCYLDARKLTDKLPSYSMNPEKPNARNDEFQADYDVYYNYACQNDSLTLGLSASPEDDSIIPLKTTLLQSRKAYEQFFHDKLTPEVVTVTGPGKLHLLNANQNSHLAHVGACGLQIKRVDIYPSLASLSQWLEDSDSQVRQIQKRLDAYRLAKNNEVRSESVELQVLQEGLIEDALLAQAMLERFQHFQDATNIHKRPVENMDLDALLQSLASYEGSLINLENIASVEQLFAEFDSHIRNVSQQLMAAINMLSHETAVH